MELRACHLRAGEAYDPPVAGSGSPGDEIAACELEALVRRRSAALEARDAAHLDDPGRLVHLRRLPARPPRFGELARPLPAAVVEALGVERLWSHQAEALDIVRDVRSVVVATRTSSGTSIVYQSAIG